MSADVDLFAEASSEFDFAEAVDAVIKAYHFPGRCRATRSVAWRRHVQVMTQAADPRSSRIEPVGLSLRRGEGGRRRSAGGTMRCCDVDSS
jgi:hypothetical protein